MHVIPIFTIWIYIYFNYHNTTMIHVIISMLLATQVVIFPSQDLEAVGLRSFSMGKHGGFAREKPGETGGAVVVENESLWIQP